MIPLLPNDTEQLANQVSAAVPLDASLLSLGESELDKHQDVGGTPLSDIQHFAITSMRHVSLFNMS